MQTRRVGSGDTVAPGAAGEICFRGCHLMRGYYAEPDKTAAAVDQAGWLRSGDLGCMDEVGYLRITGKLQNFRMRELMEAGLSRQTATQT
ncbi:MAG: AMP-binding protein [Gammaproteobacteria bacterium]|nr:AMP-binding protein [Gammaproteobacteria bacterium]